MNGPKLVTEIIAVAIIVGCCYGLFTTAIPTEYPPVDIKADESTENTISYSGMDVTISTQKFIIDSKMPSDIEDVYIELSLDSGGQKYSLGKIDVGTVTAKSVTTTESANITIPAYVVLASLAANSSDGVIKTPILAKLHFSYLEFQDEKLIDLGLNLRVDMGFKGNVEMTKTDNSATMTIDIPEGSSFTKDISNIAKSVCDSSGNCTIKIAGCEDVSFSLNISDDGKTVKFTADGVTDTAYGAMETYFKEYFEDNEEITLTYQGASSGSCTITKAQAESFEEMIKAFYGGSA